MPIELNHIVVSPPAPTKAARSRPFSTDPSPPVRGRRHKDDPKA